MKLIDKDAALSEVKKLRDKNTEAFDCGCDGTKCAGYDMACDDVTNSINSLEVKDVDLKTMFREYVTKIYTEEYSREILDGSATNVDSSDLFGAMCHGFELGLKAQKGE